MYESAELREVVRNAGVLKLYKNVASAARSVQCVLRRADEVSLCGGASSPCRSEYWRLGNVAVQLPTSTEALWVEDLRREVQPILLPLYFHHGLTITSCHVN